MFVLLGLFEIARRALRYLPGLDFGVILRTFVCPIEPIFIRLIRS